VGASTGTDSEGRVLYRAAKVGTWQVALGAVVQLPAPEESDSDSEAEEPAKAGAEADAEGDAKMGEATAPKKAKMPPVGLVQCLMQDKSGEKVAQVGGLWGWGGRGLPPFCSPLFCCVCSMHDGSAARYCTICFSFLRPPLPNPNPDPHAAAWLRDRAG
jgi:hypothetical protein